MTKPFRTLGICLILLSLALLLAGLSTFTFSEARGTILQSQLTLSGGGSYPVDKPGTGGNKPIRVPTQSVLYEFEVGERSYKSSTVGIGAASWTLSPFSKMEWEIDLENESPITVYYLDCYPYLSVLHRGPDIFTFAVLLATGGILFRFSRWLDSYDGV